MVSQTEPSAYGYPVGVELFHQGQTLVEVFFVVSGTVKLTQVDGKGRESLVGLAMSPAWVGTAAAIANRPTPVGAATCSRTILRRYPVETFLRLLDEDRRLSNNLHEAHALELCDQYTRIGQLCSSDSRGRLRAVLWRLASTARPPVKGMAVRMQLPLRQWELAEFIGVTPEHLSRLFRSMESDGLISRDKGWVIVGDVERLGDGVTCEDEHDRPGQQVPTGSFKPGNGHSRDT